MNQIQIGSRIVVIAGAAPAKGEPACREPAPRRPTARRIVLIRDGKSVGRRRGR